MNYIIWRENDHIRAISDNQKIRLKIKLKPRQRTETAYRAMEKWIQQIEENRAKLLA